jgi:hypothetical protein
MLDEIEVICAQCSYPTVAEYDQDGKIISFWEDPEAPKVEEEALAQGWYDFGLGLYCPRCSLSYLEERAREEQEGVVTGSQNDIGEIIDHEVLRALVPGVSEVVLTLFVRIFRHDRLSKLRVRAGLEPLEPMTAPEPRDEAQALEILQVSRALEAAKKESA